MMAVDIRGLVLVERKGGFLYAQPQAYGTNGTEASREMIQPFGVTGRPRSATDNIGANAIVFAHGSEVFVVATTDPRYEASLPDLGEGGAALYATAEVDGSVQTPHLGFYGANGDKDEGTFYLRVPAAGDATTVEINPSTGDVTVTHAAGTKVVVKADGVYLGDDAGAMPLVKDTPFQAWAASVVSAFQGLGVTLSAPAGTATTKVKGT